MGLEVESSGPKRNSRCANSILSATHSFKDSRQYTVSWLCHRGLWRKRPILQCEHVDWVSKGYCHRLCLDSFPNKLCVLRSRYWAPPEVTSSCTLVLHPKFLGQSVYSFFSRSVYCCMMTFHFDVSINAYVVLWSYPSPLLLFLVLALLPHISYNFRGCSMLFSYMFILYILILTTPICSSSLSLLHWFAPKDPFCIHIIFKVWILCTETRAIRLCYSVSFFQLDGLYFHPFS
jgi:hypothetical protein